MADEQIDPELQFVAVRVDPTSGYLYAPVPDLRIEADATVLAFLEAVNPGALEQAALTDHGDLPVGESFLAALKDLVDRGS